MNLPEGPAHAAIDIGTNSIHLLVARSPAPGRLEVLAQEKEVVRLGHGGSDMRRLDPDAIERGIAALHRFRQVADIWDADITAVATSAVREAENHDEFTSRARDEAGIEVEVISGVEEARLIHLGALHALPVYEERLFVVDIGGGSTELVVGQREEVLEARSLKLGAIRLTDRFFSDEPITKSMVKDCRRYVRSFLEPTARELVTLSPEVAAGCSGTIETLAAMALARRGDDPGRNLGNLSVTASEIAAVVDEIVSAPTAKERAKLPGMEAKRADIIVAGAIILEQVLAALDVDELRISTFALREGVLLDQATHRGGGPRHHLTDLRRASTVHLADALDPDRAHSDHLTALALQLFDDTADVHGLDDAYRELLEAAGLLHNVGLFISHSAHHKHSYYVIRHSEHLLGFTDHEIELIAQIARYHRKSAPKDKHPEWAGLRSADRRAVAVLAGLLRVAIGLDRSHAGAIAEVRATVDESSGRLDVVAAAADGADPSLELYSADQRKDLLADALGLDVEISLGA
ncbi:Ppx/GppA phosphatase family protein [Actinomarinicola tropica]|uniref:Ppx/GppA phosphatase family protein n=1 Tax=Actinomarinicola tropica TaxID=2789776 RepID=UPI001899D318|nr:Ppx/GppA phosphatase family protein [Actinomarinicola tropica]